METIFNIRFHEIKSLRKMLKSLKNSLKALGGIRTPDFYLTKVALYHLSHNYKIVDGKGFEPSEAYAKGS